MSKIWTSYIKNKYVKDSFNAEDSESKTFYDTVADMHHQEIYQVTEKFPIPPLSYNNPLTSHPMTPEAERLSDIVLGDL